MSRGCIIVEVEPNKWYCITARDEYDYNFKHYSVTGPKSNEETAFESHEGCNPGSSSSIDNKNFKELSTKSQKFYLKMIAKRYK
jgi:hypothetical protein